MFVLRWLSTMWGTAYETAFKDLIFFSVLNSLNELAAEAQLMQRMFSGNFNELWTRIYSLMHPSCLSTVWESLQLQVIFSTHRNWIYKFLGAQKAIAATGVHTDISIWVASSSHPSPPMSLFGSMPVSAGFRSLSWLQLTGSVPGLTIYLFG